MDGLSTGDTAWMLASTALVLFMTPGLAAFYGGMVRKKNVLSTTMHSFFAIGSVGVIWAVIGYSLAFSGGSGALSAFVGGFDFVGLNNVTGLIGTIPHSVFAMFQGMFAIITVALITGSVAERMKFKAYVIFTSAWAILVYSPLAHWVWQGNGWLFKLGALDFAGGTVVHISSAAAALAAAIVLGKRKGLNTEAMRPNNLPLTVLGAGILWFGWFGFNAGSALGANELAGVAFLNTMIAASAAVVGWTIVETMHSGKPTVLGAASGAIAGLVVITPAAGFVAPWAAILMGLLAGGICYFGLYLKKKFKFDDALDVVGIHGVGGTLGAILTGVFATTAINSLGSGLVDGNGKQVLIQLVAVVAAWVFSFGLSFIILKVTDKLVGLRVDEESEVLGLDLALHSEEGYVLD
ncbi:MAG: ammonium transporter [Coriobacteriia bacterium]|nr:ammonium transporter [Coriobacteriia bacterium]